MNLIIIRHGQTEWALNGRHTSRTDLALTDAGRAQAVKLGPRLAGRAFAQVLTSPRLRARQTCELAGFGARAEVDEDLREFDYGEYEGLTKAEILAKDPGWSVFTHPCPGGEVLAQVVVRANRIVARARAAKGDTLVFTHGHLGRILATCWLGQPAQFGANLALDTCALNVLSYDGTTAVLQTWNCAAEG